MEFIDILEFFGMAFAISGAIYMSRDSKIVPNHMFKAFLVFFISNMFMIIVAAVEGMIPFFIQQCFFMIGAYLGLIYYLKKLYTNYFYNYIKFINIITIIYIIVVIIILFNLSNNYTFNITIIELAAAILAISGNFILKADNLNIRSYAFIFFIIADIIYVYIAIDHNLLFFTSQSLFFVFTGIIGLKNTLKNIKLNNSTQLSSN